VAIKTDWDGFEGGPKSDEFDDETDLPPELIKAQTVSEMVEAAAVMGFNLLIRMKMGGETVKITVESGPDETH
jgi:hypothetical protein